MSSSFLSEDEYELMAFDLLDSIDASDNDERNLTATSHTRRYIQHEHQEVHDRLMRDYFVKNCKYNPDNFKRRFRMRKRVFLRIMNDILIYNANPQPYYFKWFHRRLDAKGELSISTELKITSALRQHSYGNTPDAFDEYLQISERMREPTYHDIVCLYEAHERLHGFQGMMESIDCMHWA
ncbi:uncharacterized protein [Rutidosis leptorrhynchoides]|uniref:uncharacterized protein n=1 Tax=Rutidosis leptorrhynchoides TaxID=125765 RepID=UPI003A9928E5